MDFVVDELPTPGYLTPRPSHEVRRVQSSSALSVNQDEPPKDPPKWKAALGEAQYFAGGLVSRPAETVRHFSILRHSHALVWYRGPSTSVSITILSDEPLPANRTIWLQQKGYSGNMGMSLKALVGTNGDWIEVTPETKAAPEHLPEMDERGMQRDLKRFAKKASGRAKKHVPRETHVIRIPAEATDGYFRLVLCAGEGSKKLLCGSPVFRVASTSTDVSVVKGASLSTMPIEIGVKVASTVGEQVVKKYTGVVGAVVSNGATKAASNKAAQKIMPVMKKAATMGTMAYNKSGMNDMVSDSWQRGKQAGRYEPMVMEAAVDVIGDDSGPEAPFPVDFAGKVVRGSGLSANEIGVPTANLREVPDRVKMRMKGVFAAWACIISSTAMDDISHDWHEAIVTIGPLRYAPPDVVIKNRVRVHLMHDFDGATFFDFRIKVFLMGYLHDAPDKDAEPEDLVRQHAADSVAVLASLQRPAWDIDEALRSRGERSLSDKMDGFTGMVRGEMDKLPLHLAGVRSEGSKMRDQAYGKGGLWIPR